MVETSTTEKINIYSPFDYESQTQWNQQNKINNFIAEN